MKNPYDDDDENDDDDEDELAGAVVANQKEFELLQRARATPRTQQGWSEVDAPAAPGPSSTARNLQHPSPPRRPGRHDTPDDASPPRRPRRHDTPDDASPPRRPDLMADGTRAGKVLASDLAEEIQRKSEDKQRRLAQVSSHELGQGAATTFRSKVREESTTFSLYL